MGYSCCETAQVGELLAADERPLGPLPGRDVFIGQEDAVDPPARVVERGRKHANVEQTPIAGLPHGLLTPKHLAFERACPIGIELVSPVGRRDGTGLPDQFVF